MKKYSILLTTLFSFSSLTVSGQSLDSSFSQPAGMSDQQARESKDFVHQGRKDAILKKACEEANGACDQDSPDKQSVLLPSAIEDNIGRLYTMLFGGMGFLTGGAKVTLKDKPAATDGAEASRGDQNPPSNSSESGTQGTNQNQDKDANKGADYCIYIPMVYEGVAMAVQTGQQQQISQEAANLNDPQLSALVQLKETHKTRKRTATMQSAIYGSTAACYVAQMLLRPIKTDTTYFIKMGAAAGISVLYLKKADKHAKAMKQIQKVIDAFPKAGDCNPWTGSSCFCREPTSKNLYPGQYQQVCVLNNGVADGPKANLGCGVMVNGKVQYDAKCQCKANKTCVTASLKFANPGIGLGANFLNQANRGLSLLDTSQFDEGKLRDFSNSAAALNNRIKPKQKHIGDINLNEKEKKIAESLADVLPPDLAKIAARSPISDTAAGGLMNGTTSSALSALPENVKKQMGASEISGNYRRGGNGSSANVADTDSGFSFNMPKIPGQEGAAPGTEIVTFADKAISDAEVSNRPDTPIFDIISNRYRSSAWGRLQSE